jgi:hypothetical protein
MLWRPQPRDQRAQIYDAVVLVLLSQKVTDAGI